jgi:hypothetical protein
VGHEVSGGHSSPYGVVELRGERRRGFRVGGVVVGGVAFNNDGRCSAVWWGRRRANALAVPIEVAHWYRRRDGGVSAKKRRCESVVAEGCKPAGSDGAEEC